MGAMPATAGYLTIAAAIREQIESGALQPGDRLPGIRAIGKAHSVSAQTASEALRHLAGGGWVVVAKGKATVVADRVPDAVLTVSGLAGKFADLEERVARLEAQVSPALPGEPGQT